MPTFPFAPAGRADSGCNAYCLAAAARAAYLDAAALGSLLLEDWGLHDYHRFASPSAQGYLANGDGFAVLAFRGSDHRGLDAWISNADFDLVDDLQIGGGQVHSGFQRGVAAIWPQLERLVAQHRAPGQKLFLTGHSLGGALAMLAAARFAAASRGGEIDAIFTFGQPRVGDGGFAAQFDRDFHDRAFRYVHHFDLVARLPPRLLGYHHAGQLRFIDEGGTLHENLSRWQQLLVTLDPRGRNTRDYINELSAKLPGALADHRCARYLERLQVFCPGARLAAPTGRD